MWPFDDPQKENEAAFGQGQADREEATGLGEVLHDAADIFTGMLPECDKHKCYEAGWHEKDKDKE